uniref:Potassium channel tetramerisation-type BTB domain-containing protein n=1 Tax=Vitrella brassicaformis TaxID=1169539 RepID=A0A7S1PA10_9ALVE
MPEVDALRTTLNESINGAAEAVNEKEAGLKKLTEELHRIKTENDYREPTIVSERVLLNVGGLLMEEGITRAILTKQKGTLFAELFSGHWEHRLKRDSEGRIFLDVDPEAFGSFLNDLMILGCNATTVEPSDARHRFYYEMFQRSVSLDTFVRKESKAVQTSDLQQPANQPHPTNLNDAISNAFAQLQEIRSTVESRLTQLDVAIAEATELKKRWKAALKAMEPYFQQKVALREGEREDEVLKLVVVGRPFATCLSTLIACGEESAIYNRFDKYALRYIDNVAPHVFSYVLDFCRRNRYDPTATLFLPSSAEAVKREVQMCLDMYSITSRVQKVAPFHMTRGEHHGMLGKRDLFTQVVTTIEDSTKCTIREMRCLYKRAWHRESVGNLLSAFRGGASYRRIRDGDKASKATSASQTTVDPNAPAITVSPPLPAPHSARLLLWRPSDSPSLQGVLIRREFGLREHFTRQGGVNVGGPNAGFHFTADSLGMGVDQWVLMRTHEETVNITIHKTKGFNIPRLKFSCHGWRQGQPRGTPPDVRSLDLYEAGDRAVKPTANQAAPSEAAAGEYLMGFNVQRQTERGGNPLLSPKLVEVWGVEMEEGERDRAAPAAAAADGGPGPAAAGPAANAPIVIP